MIEEKRIGLNVIRRRVIKTSGSLPESMEMAKNQALHNKEFDISHFIQKTLRIEESPYCCGSEAGGRKTRLNSFGTENNFMAVS